MKNKPKEELRRIQKLFLNQMGHTNRQRRVLHRGSDEIISENIMKNIFGNEEKKFNPLCVLNGIMPGNLNRNMVAMGMQNWVTENEQKNAGNQRGGQLFPMLPGLQNNQMQPHTVPLPNSPFRPSNPFMNMMPMQHHLPPFPYYPRP